MASIFCRDRGTFAVGRRGGIEALGGTGTKSDRKKYPLIYGWES